MARTLAFPSRENEALEKSSKQKGDRNRLALKKKNHSGSSRDREGKGRRQWEPAERLLSASSLGGRWSGPAWWAGQSEGVALNLVPPRRDRALDF